MLNIAPVSHFLIQHHIFHIVLVVGLGAYGISWHPSLRTVDDHITLGIAFEMGVVFCIQGAKGRDQKDQAS